MAKVVGIGGVFFRAKDPAGLAEWYEKHLRIDNLHKSVWRQEAGMTIFGPFSENTDYFGRADQQWMINFRVDDLDGLMAELKASGIAVETRAEWDSEVGRFARIHDPEGNPVELWEPTKDCCGTVRLLRQQTELSPDVDLDRRTLIVPEQGHRAGNRGPS
jgi:predicted enzyme related to lactoylglutathione lyase